MVVRPAVYTTDKGSEVQSFDAIYTDAFAFFDSLTDDQQNALISGDVSMCASGDTCDFPTGVGLSGADLTEEQSKLLLDLIANWSDMADEETPATARAQISASLHETVIAWPGEMTYAMSAGDGISFSVSRLDVYIGLQAENGSAGADVDGVTTSGWGHVHSIYRDPTNDYANSVAQQEATGMSVGGGGAPGSDGNMPSGGSGIGEPGK